MNAPSRGRGSGVARGSPVPVIALTAVTLDEAVGRSFDAACDTHVSKPLRCSTQVTALREVVAAYT